MEKVALEKNLQEALDKAGPLSVGWLWNDPMLILQ